MALRICVAMLMLALAGCGSASSPLAPYSPQPAPAPQPAPQPAPEPPLMANLKISDASVVVVAHDDGGRRTYSYIPRFVVTETSGVSAAVVIGVEVAVANGPIERTDEKCWGSGIRVEAGATSYAFGPGWWERLLYCTPEGFTSTEPVPFVSIGVSYKDNAGTWGSVSARIDINR